MTTDLRKVIRVNKKILRPFQSLQHFDIYPDRLVPKRDWVLDTTATTNKLTRFTFFDDLSGYTLWGLGMSGTKALLQKKTSPSLTAAWTSVSNGTTAGNVSSNPFLFGFAGYLYFMVNGGLGRYNVASATLTEPWKTLSPVNVAKPVFHSRSGYAYFFFDDGVYRLDASDNWVKVQVVPTGFYITSARPAGNNLAIGCAPLNGYGDSFTYLWDLGETTLPAYNTFSEAIRWGRGKLLHLDYQLGVLVGVSNEQIDNDISVGKGRMVAGIYRGVTAQEASYITADTTQATPIGTDDFSDAETLYFPASMPFKGIVRTGIWSVNANGTFSIDAIGPSAEAGHQITGLYRWGKSWFVAFDDNNVYRTNDQASNTVAAIMETTVYGDRMNSSQFVGATISFEALTTGQSVTLKYKHPEDTSWTTMKSQSTVGQRQLQAIGTNLAQAPVFTEYQWRVESIGAIITGLAWTTEANDQNIYG